VLCGLRDVRDDKVLSGGEPRLGTASPFNIKAESLRLANFTEAQVCELYEQHTAATGQVFEPEAKAKAFELTGGQPWLVNALANHIVRKMGIPFAQAITSLDMENAAQALIIERQTHLDSLVDKLTEDRVQRVVNGGGIIDREYGVGRGRMDVLVRWPLPESKSARSWPHPRHPCDFRPPKRGPASRNAHANFRNKNTQGIRRAAFAGVNSIKSVFHNNHATFRNCSIT
jgi:hypothetical protein